MQTLIDVVVRQHNGISLRVVDYLCTNYAKRHDVVYYVGNSKIPFNLYLQYRAQLKAYSKRQFDPFRRHERITIKVPESILEAGTLETTVAQLNFFKWAIENKVLEYLENDTNRKKIEKHMMSKQETSSKPQVKELSGKTKRHNIQVTVTFK